MNNATTKIQIPSYTGLELMEIEVRRPNVVRALANKEIPNPLMGAAAEVINGEKEGAEKDPVKQAVRFAERVQLYCYLVMVSPTFEEVEEKLTQEQQLEIFMWAVKPFRELDRFSANGEGKNDNRDGKPVREKTE